MKTLRVATDVGGTFTDLVAFESGPSSPTGGTVVFVPGLTDGPMSLSYLPRLAEALAEALAEFAADS